MSKKKEEGCKVCRLYDKLRLRDAKEIARKKDEIPNISFRIKARVVHEQYAGIDKIGAEMTSPIDMRYCPLCGKKLWNTNWAGGSSLAQ